MAIGFSSRVWRWNFRKQASGSVPTANGGGEYVFVRNVGRDRDGRGPRRGGDRPLGSAGNDGSRRDGVVAVSASRRSPAPARGLSTAQQEREARAAAAQRRLVAAAAQQE